jgi:hypothetical protein
MTIRIHLIALQVCLLLGSAYGQTGNLNNTKINGYRGIWFELGQKSAYGDKYSGGLGTYTAKHHPLAVYCMAVDKTFFVFGGTNDRNERYLLCMIGAFDHKTGTVCRPTVVHDKQGVNDPHDNPSLLIDAQGYIWVFVSGRGRSRPGFKYRSVRPYDINAFVQITEEEMTYPQPWLIGDSGFLHLFTKYTGVRELYFETSVAGLEWTADQKLSGIRETGHARGGHYQVSNTHGPKLVTFFNRHPNGVVDRRTDLYYVQTIDFGRTWTTVDGQLLDIPLTEVNSPARAQDYARQKRNVYLKDVNFDEQGHPICLYVTSGGHEPGPDNNPREFRVTYWTGQDWRTRIVCETDHNYDMGSLFITENSWYVVAPTADGPQHYGTGGEIVIWISNDRGERWRIQKQMTVNSPRNHAYVRRVVRGQAPFHFFWSDGNAERFSQARLYFGSLDGDVWELPYEMGRDGLRPAKRTIEPQP